METATLQLEAPFFLLLSGPSHAGKSSWTKRLIQNADKMIDTPIFNFYWCYTIAQDWMRNLTPKVSFHQGVIDFDKVPPNSLVVLDDLQDELTTKDSKIASRISHHKKISVIYITQNLFFKGPAHRDISLNANYICLFRNPRDKLQAMNLARQLFPGKSDYFLKSYEDATSVPHGYLLLCLRQATPDALRLVSNIFPSEKLAVYIPKIG